MERDIKGRWSTGSLPTASAEAICTHCKSVFQYVQYGCHGRSVCDACRLVAHKNAMAKVRVSVNGRASQERYIRSPLGKETRARYASSPKARLQHKAYKMTPTGRKSEERYWKSPKWLEARRRYLQSPKGRAALSRMRILWRSGDSHAEYLSFKNEAFRDRVPCASCGKPWVDGHRGVTHEIDHILPRKLGGTHSRDNLQVLCYECHLAKTRIDRGMMKCHSQ